MSQEESTHTSLVSTFASKFSIEPNKLMSTLKATAFKQSGNNQVSDEQMASLLIVANEYNLNPFTKEIYAFPSNGGIQPIVSIDGWLKIINSHPKFDGMEFEDEREGGNLTAVTCRIFRKDRSHAVEVTEYLSECSRNTDPWRKYPVRMLRHKATIQCARYAFSFSGIVDPDEGERIQEATSKDMGSAEVVTEQIQDAYPQESFDENLPKWTQLINKGKRTPDEVIKMVESKATLTEDMKNQILNIQELAA